jgi:RimJ/RimL family protein N-acetyltransferase
MKGPEHIETTRLVLRKPTAADAEATRLYALCHPDHQASIHVLEKCGFVLEGLLTGFVDFPNLGSGQLEDCLRYALVADRPASKEY